MKILKKIKILYQVFIQSTIVTNINMIAQSLTYLDCLEVLTQNYNKQTQKKGGTRDAFLTIQFTFV